MEQPNVTINKYPEYKYDEDTERLTDELETYAVFSTIDVGPYTKVRAVTRNFEGKPALPRDIEWFVEYHVTLDNYTTVTVKLMQAGVKASRGHALMIAEKARQWVDNVNFSKFMHGDHALEFLSECARKMREGVPYRGEEHP